MTFARIFLLNIETIHDDSTNNAEDIRPLYCKPVTIVNYDAMVVNMLETSHTDDNRVVIYDRHMFIVQATEHYCLPILLNSTRNKSTIDVTSMQQQKIPCTIHKFI